MSLSRSPSWHRLAIKLYFVDTDALWFVVSGFFVKAKKQKSKKKEQKAKKDTVLHLEVLDREVDDCGILLEEPVVLLESLHVEDEIARQLRDDILFRLLLHWKILFVLFCFVFEKLKVKTNKNEVMTETKEEEEEEEILWPITILCDNELLKFRGGGSTCSVTPSNFWSSVKRGI